MPKVSVIIPTYNRADLLHRVIQSVLNQTYQDFEIIVVDDGSADNTEEIVRGFSDPRIRYFRHAENKGPGAARNTGIKNSRGEFIAFLDSDDEWLPQKLEKQTVGFEKSPGNVVLVGTNHYLIKGSEKQIGITKTKSKKRFTPSLSSWMLHRRVIEKIGLFDERIVISQDMEFFSRFRRKFSFHFINEPLFNRYLSQDGAYADMEKVIRMRKQYLPSLKSEPRLYAKHMNYLAKDYCLIGQTKEARKCFLKAFIAYPLNLGYFIKFLKIKRKWIYRNIVQTKDGRFMRQV